MSSSSLKRPDDALRANLSLIVFALVVVGYIAGVALVYQLPANLFLKGVWYATMNFLEVPALWIGPVVGLVLGIVIFAVCVNRYVNHFGGAQFVKRLRGPK